MRCCRSSQLGVGGPNCTDSVSGLVKPFNPLNIKKQQSQILYIHAAPSKWRHRNMAKTVAKKKPHSEKRCLLVLKVRSELDYARAEILDRLTISWKWSGTRSEKRIDCGGACMVEEVKELCD
jgi:hypothetical protein